MLQLKPTSSRASCTLFKYHVWQITQSFDRHTDAVNEFRYTVKGNAAILHSVCCELSECTWLTHRKAAASRARSTTFAN